MKRYTLKENENFVANNIADYEKYASVRREFYERGIYVDINKTSTFKTVEKYYHLFDNTRNCYVPMRLGKDFEKVYHIYTEGRLNLTATSMNDGSNFKLFIIEGYCTRIKKIA